MLYAPVSPSATTIQVLSNPVAALSWPAAPYTLLLDWGTANAEVVLVTAVTGSGPYTLTVTRGVDGTTAQAHAITPYDNVFHGVSAQDFAEYQAHATATGQVTSPSGTTVGVHGIGAGSGVVGLTETQTLSNKTFTSAAFTQYTGDATTGTISSWNSQRTYHSVTLSGNVTVGSADGQQANGQVIMWEFRQAASGGPYAVTFGSQFTLSEPFRMNATASAVCAIAFRWGSDGTWRETWRSAPSGAVVTPQVFGAKGDGSTDDTAAFQAMINYVTGSAAPASNTRSPLVRCFVPPATYKVTSDINVLSVQGLDFRGGGAFSTIFKASGAGFTRAVLNIDGARSCVFEGFSVQGDGTESVPSAVRLDWTTAAARSTSSNVFRDVCILNCKYVTGFDLSGNGSRQVDGTKFYNCQASGGQSLGSWSGSGNWQVGFQFGNGTFGNNYNHVLYGCEASLNNQGVNCNASGFAMFGGQPFGNGTDFVVVQGAQCTIDSVQSQNCGMFLSAPSGSVVSIPVGIRDCLVKTVFLQSSRHLVDIAGGSWKFENFCASNVQVGNNGTYVSGLITITGAASSRWTTVTLENVLMQGTKLTCIVPQNNTTQVLVKNYTNYTVATASTTFASGDLVSAFSGTSWTNLA